MNKTERPDMGEERMGLEEAQEEAGMMKVRLAEIVGHEPTSEDYDKALEVVEEMKAAAENETDFDKALIAVNRVGIKYYAGPIVDIFVRAVTLGKFNVTHWAQGRGDIFDSAEKKLEKLKQAAEKVG
jgi:hypothetical protein